MRLRVLLRLVEIHRALVRHGLADFVRATHLYRPLRFVFLLSPWAWFERDSKGTRGARLRLALEELGFFTDHVRILGVYPAGKS